MENIAVVGIANLFPGSCAPEEFWQQLLNKQDCRTKASKAQMGVDPAKYTGNKGDIDKVYFIQGGYISDFDFQAEVLADRHVAKGHAVSANYLSQFEELVGWPDRPV